MNPLTILTCAAIGFAAGSVAWWIGFRTGHWVAERAFVSYKRVYRIELAMYATALRICEYSIETLGDGAVGARARARDDALSVIRETLRDVRPREEERLH